MLFKIPQFFARREAAISSKRRTRFAWLSHTHTHSLSLSRSLSRSLSLSIFFFRVCLYFSRESRDRFLRCVYTESSNVFTQQQVVKSIRLSKKIFTFFFIVLFRKISFASFAPPPSRAKKQRCGDRAREKKIDPDYSKVYNPQLCVARIRLQVPRLLTPRIPENLPASLAFVILQLALTRSNAHTSPASSDFFFFVFFFIVLHTRFFWLLKKRERSSA